MVNKTINKNNKITKKSLSERIDKLNGDIEGLTEGMNKIIKAISVDEPQKRQDINELHDEPKAQATSEEDEQIKMPVPRKYRDIADKTLNQKFGIHLEQKGDSTNFMLEIVVPREYSPLTEEEWKFHRADLRSRVLPYSSGINGVKDWVEKIWNSFDNDVQAKISSDREL